MEEFRAEYGGQEEWDAAGSAGSVGSDTAAVAPRDAAAARPTTMPEENGLLRLLGPGGP